MECQYGLYSIFIDIENSEYRYRKITFDIENYFSISINIELSPCWHSVGWRLSFMIPFSCTDCYKHSTSTGPSNKTIQHSVLMNLFRAGNFSCYFRILCYCHNVRKWHEKFLNLSNRLPASTDSNKSLKSTAVDLNTGFPRTQWLCFSGHFQDFFRFFQDTQKRVFSTFAHHFSV